MEENMYWVGKISRKAFLGHYLISGVFLIISILFFLGIVSEYVPLLANFSFYIGIAAIFAVGLIMAIVEIKRITVKYEISNRRVLKENGIINKKTDYIPYHMVEKISLEKRWYERLLKIGTIKIDTGETHFYLFSVDRPDEVEDILRRAMGGVTRYGDDGQRNSTQNSQNYSQKPPKQNKYRRPTRNNYNQRRDDRRRR